MIESQLPSPAEIQHSIQTLVDACHGAARNSGWWTDPKTGVDHEDTNDKFGLRIALVHSELSEALEGRRKNLTDEHLPQHRNDVVELGDALIRIFDMAGGLKMNLAWAVADKLAYNAVRQDHKLENRVKDGGKAF